MNFVNLGNTGLKISRVLMGCGNFGGVGSAPEFFGQGESESEAHALLDEAYELGITVFDTADAYGGGRSETYLGNWLRAKGSATRDKLLISTKVFYPVAAGPNHRGLSRLHIMRQVEASLQRLAVDHLDMYLIHEPDPSTPMEETLRTMDELVHQGKVRYIGASNMPAWLLTKSLWRSDKYNLQRFDWVQNSFSLLERADEREMFPLCDDQRLGYTPFSPLAGGFLTGKYRFEKDYPSGSRMILRPEPYFRHWKKQTFALLETLRAMAAERNISMAGLALAWVLTHPSVTAPIVGPRRAAHFEPIREALSFDLSTDDFQEIASLFNSGKDIS